MKPMLASDWIESKVKFPLWQQPKIDGVRGMNMGLGFTGRSMKQPGNVFACNYFSQSVFRGFDGEMAAEEETHPSLCRLTSSAMSSYEGTPWLMWHVFDYLTDETKHLGYRDRYELMRDRVMHIKHTQPNLGAHLKVVPVCNVLNMDQLEKEDARLLDLGYEGSILRKPNGLHKQGRSTPTEGGLLRIKRFIEKEFLITGIIEGEANGNEATIGLNGYTERSTHQENMTKNGMVGSFIGTDLETGQPIKVSAGKIPHDLRGLYFRQQELVLNKIGKYKTFPKGVKDKPRFPTFQTLRMESDL